MSELAFTVEGGQTVRLKTAGKYCDRNIVVTATGGDTEAAYQQGVADGKQAEYDFFWDKFQDYGNRTVYSYAFCYENFSDTTFIPKYPLKPIQAGTMFYSSVLTAVNVTLDLSEATTCGTMFAYAFDLAIIKDLIVNENLDGLSTAFRACGALTTLGISGVIGKNIDLHWSPLAKASIENVMAILSNTATGMTATFQKSAVNAAFETSEGLADGSTSAEWLALVATKPNWTISLV